MKTARRSTRCPTGTLPLPEMIMSRSTIGCILAGSISLLSGCSSDPAVSEVAGECDDAFGTEVCTWASMRGDQVVELGAVVRMASIEAAAPDQPMAWPPLLGAEAALPPAATQSTGVTHMTFYWEPVGHAPATYMTPHFDFHFYLVPPSERIAYDCSDESKPAQLPTGYVLPDETLPPEIAAMIGVETLVGVCVPEMGMHALVESELEVEALFDGTMIIGYYAGEPIFFEPMISKAKLQERRSFDLSMPSVPGMQGRIPDAFRAEYDAASDAYRFTFSGFVQGQ